MVHIQGYTLKTGCTQGGGSKILQPVGNCPPNYATLHPRRLIITWSSWSLIITNHSTDRHFPNYAKVKFRKIWRKLNLHKSEWSVCVYSRTPRNRTLLVRNANYPDQLAPSGKYVEISTKINLPWNCRLSDQEHYGVMASRFPNQEWSKGLDAGTYCK
jgi:hypothetical protein